jgi:hypothetical protein
MFQTLNIKKMYLIDSYEPYFEPLIPEASSKRYHYYMAKAQEQLLKPFDSKIQRIYLYSDDAFKYVTDDLDFCYLDGDHSFNQVTCDIEHYGGLLHTGGVLGGHDFSTPYFGVCKAVVNSIVEPKWGVLQGKTYDWWAVKQF